MKRVFTYKLLAWISLVPLIGGLFSMFVSWVKIYTATQQKRYVLLHYAFLCVYLIVGIIPFALSLPLLNNESYALRLSISLAFAYVYLMGMGLLAVLFSCRMEKRYNERTISQ